MRSQHLNFIADNWRGGQRCGYLIVVFVLLLAACGSGSLIRYGNRAVCVGHLGAGAEAASRGYPFPIRARYAEMVIGWHQASKAFILNDDNTTVQVIRMNSTVTTSQLTGTGLALAKTDSLLATNAVFGDLPAVLISNFEDDSPPDGTIRIVKAASPAWHPSGPLLSVIYFPDSDQQYSDLVAIVDLASSSTTPMEVIRTNHLAIAENLGWSTTGDIIAISQYDSNGLVPYYLFGDLAKTVRSGFSSSQNNCVLDAQWSPKENILAFSGTNSSMQGWDIMLETIATLEGAESSLINLTNTPFEDEISSAWSPTGRQIAFVKAWVDPNSELRQDLYVVELDELESPLFQVTDTLIEYETSPMWISDTEIAYLSWVPDEPAWYLKVLSVAEPEGEPEIILRLPESWYRAPGQIE